MDTPTTDAPVEGTEAPAAEGAGETAEEETPAAAE